MEKEKVKHLNRKVAVSVALISTFMAVSKVKDDNIVQGMLQAKTDALDTWAQYQSKKIKQHLAETAISQNETLKLIVPARADAMLENQIKKYRVDIERYQNEEKDLATRAKDFEAKYDKLNYSDDQFDISDACLSIALMMLAVTALTAEQWLLWLSWSLGASGILVGFAGFFHWNIHPDWLVKLLT